MKPHHRQHYTVTEVEEISLLFSEGTTTPSNNTVGLNSQRDSSIEIYKQFIWLSPETSSLPLSSNQQDYPFPGRVLLLEVNSAFRFYFLQDRPTFMLPLKSHCFMGCRFCTCCWRIEICFSMFLFVSSSSSSCSLKLFFSSSICFSLVLRLSFRRVSSCSSSYKANSPVEFSTAPWL